MPQLELDPTDNVKSGKEFFLIFKNLSSMPHSDSDNIKKALFVNIKNKVAKMSLFLLGNLENGYGNEKIQVLIGTT